MFKKNRRLKLQPGQAIVVVPADNDTVTAKALEPMQRGEDLPVEIILEVPTLGRFFQYANFSAWAGLMALSITNQASMWAYIGIIVGVVIFTDSAKTIGKLVTKLGKAWPGGS